MAPYELTQAADADFENIFDFGIDTFGLAQAIDYQQGMQKRFEELADQPERYAAVDHIRSGYRRCVYHSHSIYYRIEMNRVLIIRILGKQNLHKQLK
ncbi:MAG: type II toxin-antitoxin system RelE/ParE family toxin [Gammaproteobacteria bacterium]|nr:MAG: type II toxin-antitoxin system RelE/ParE family toxin [Gammaproteobacteria bacterium]